MAAILGLSLLALVFSLICNYHHAIVLVEGRMPVSVSLSEEEDLQLETQLKSLNKLPIKTIYAEWGDIYDCIEFHKQPAFDHPLLKKHKLLIRNEPLATKSNATFLGGIDGCPKGTVPIRRTTKDDLIRAKSLSLLSSSEAHGDIQYRAGYQLSLEGQKLYGASGIVNVWNPNVENDQFSSAEITLKSGPAEQVNGMKFGWMVNPQLYGDNVTRGFTYWTGDGSHKTGCYNTLCPGYVQVDARYTPDLPFETSSIFLAYQYVVTVDISLEPEGWWLTLTGNSSTVSRMGYWPRELFPLFTLTPGDGVDSIYWGGRVKSGRDGAVPPMCSGHFAGPTTDATGYFLDVKYKDVNGNLLKPDMDNLQHVNDCPEFYSAQYYADDNQIHFGGKGGGLTGRCYS
ncbi:hypothetical protein MKW94_027408 [Papaver nudicaule]|uniref:Neprosin PEP catalytic domain-containing protein n=1 Tax=Papaver nudicaule TaxID=74823 RepID=A0AA41VS59_PAPNU|nr:hypothetical protein [Papaver nudicaule]